MFASRRSASVGLRLRVLPFVLGAEPLLHSEVLQLRVLAAAAGHAVRVAAVEVGRRLLDLVADGCLLGRLRVQLFKLQIGQVLVLLILTEILLLGLGVGVGRSGERVVHVSQHFPGILGVVEAVRVLVAEGLLVREKLLRIFTTLELLRVVRVVTATVQPLGLRLLEAGVCLLLVVAGGTRVLQGLLLASLLVLRFVRKMALVHFCRKWNL